MNNRKGVEHNEKLNPFTILLQGYSGRFWKYKKLSEAIT
jgi:hypothetical protein